MNSCKKFLNLEESLEKDLKGRDKLFKKIMEEFLKISIQNLPKDLVDKCFQDSSKIFWKRFLETFLKQYMQHGCNPWKAFEMSIRRSFCNKWVRSYFWRKFQRDSQKTLRRHLWVNFSRVNLRANVWGNCKRSNQPKSF